VNEHSFIKSVHRYLPSDVFRWKIHDTFTGGVPDAMYGGPAGLLFIEYKYVPKLPVKESTLIKTSLNAQQIKWLDRLSSFGQRTAVVIGCEDTAIILTDGQWTENISRAYYLAHSITRKHVADWIEAMCKQEVSNDAGQNAAGAGSESA